MPLVTLDQISQIIFRNKQLFVPDCVERAIVQTVENSVDLIKQAGEELIDTYGSLDEPIKFNYSRSDIVDAYSLFYTRRNVLIPRITLRDLVLNPNFRKFPTQIRVLDIGSGTGAIVLGLLEMFDHPPLNSIGVQVDAIDISELMLVRLKQLLEAAQLAPQSIETMTLDLRNTDALGSKLDSRGKYDFIFAGNVFGELAYDEATNILKCITEHLSSRGVITIVDAQRDYVKKMLPVLIKEASQLGLSVYYPCPPNRVHSCGQCWFWREYEYSHKILKVQGKILIGSYREQLVAHWLILSSKAYSIYDDFVEQHPDLEWGPLSIYGSDSRYCDSQVCTSKEIKNWLRVGKSYKRGSIVGGAGDPFQITQYFEL